LNVLFGYVGDFVYQFPAINTPIVI
jgi:hypothetical protein